MAENVHSMAPHHLPGFLPGPDGGDAMFTGVVVGMIILVLLLGVGYFTLHALPEKMAHKANSTQLQLIGILTLLAMFTHNNIFWVVALLLAAVRLPDFGTPLNSIARSLERMQRGEAPPQAAAVEAVAEAAPAPVVEAAAEAGAAKGEPNNA